MTTNPTGQEALIERLRQQARSESEASRMMAEAKSLRQGDCDPPRNVMYVWVKPEATLSWLAADEIERLGVLDRARERENDFALLDSPIPEARVSLLARAIRHSLRSYGHSCSESTLPECIASDVELALAHFANEDHSNG